MARTKHVSHHRSTQGKRAVFEAVSVGVETDAPLRHSEAVRANEVSESRLRKGNEKDAQHQKSSPAAMAPVSNFGAQATLAPKSVGPPVALASTIVKSRGRPATRSLTCDVCERTFAHRASVIRHRKTVHRLNAADEPINSQPSCGGRRPFSCRQPAVSPSTDMNGRRVDGHRFYGGKRPPGTAPGWTPDCSAFGADDNAPKCRRLQLEGTGAQRTSTRIPVEDLLGELRRHPSDSVDDIARRLQRSHQWTEEHTPAVRQRLDDLRAAQLDIVGRIQRTIPIEQSEPNVHRFLHQLQEMVDRINSAPEVMN